MNDVKTCQQIGDRPGCLGIADSRYTMDFEDVEPGAKIYWCAYCGPEAHKMEAALSNAIATRGKQFIEELRNAIDDVSGSKDES